MTAKKRKSLIKKIAENRKVRRVVLGISIFFAVVCLGAAFSEGVFRSPVGIEGFDREYLDVSTSTRRALKSELERFVLLNTGDEQAKAHFKLRNGSASEIKVDEDGNKSGSFYVDSEELQISAFVQMVWNGGFSGPDESFIVRIDCANGEANKYENSHCYSRSTGEKARAIANENLGLLTSYGVSVDAVEYMRDEMLGYLKIAYPEAKTALIRMGSIKPSDSAVHAKLRLDNGKIFEIYVTNVDNWSLELKSGENVLWSSRADEVAKGYRHYSVLQKQLPVELKTESGTKFALHFEDKNRLVISSASCADGEKDEKLKQTAKTWLEANGFDPETFEIKLKNSCES